MLAGRRAPAPGTLSEVLGSVVDAAFEELDDGIVVVDLRVDERLEEVLEVDVEVGVVELKMLDVLDEVVLV